MSESVLNNQNKQQELIIIKKITKEYPNTVALEDISFNIRKGEIFCIIGPNGAGKSTIVKLLTGQIKASKGEIRIHEFDTLKDRKKILGMFGLVPQEIALYNELTGRENLEFHGRLFNLSKQFMTQKIDELLVMAGLIDRQHDLVKTYSGGMKRRLQLIRALLHEPEIVILDEPTLGVDVQSRNAIHKYILDLPSKGKTVVLTTNYMEEAERLADRLIILDTKIIDGPGRLLEIQEKVFPNLIIEFKTERAMLKSEFLTIFLQDELKGKVISEKDMSERHVILQIIFDTTHVEEIFEKFIAYTKANDIPIEEFTIKRPDLEDVFIKLTGKEFRE